MFKKWQRSKETREQELRVAAAILASTQDPRAKQLYEQMALGRRNIREERDNGFTLTVPEPAEDLLVDLEANVESAWVRVPDTQSGQPLEFRVTLRRGGFFHSLEGRAVEGAWPSVWQVDEIALGQAARGTLKLPSSLGT